MGTVANRRSSRAVVVVPEQSTKTFTAFDGAGVVAGFIARIDQQVFQPLMISFLVIMQCQSGWDTKDYRTAVRSGRAVIAPVMEMEKQFSNTEHMLIMYGGTGSGKHEWQTVSFFGGRYELTMSVDFF